MGTVKQLLAVATSQLGIKEYPPNSNIVLYNDLYWGKGQYGSWAAWCAVFCWWCCEKANVKLPIRTASCGELMNAAKKAGMWVTKNFQPGDLTIFDWSGTKTTTNHVGIVESVIAGYGVITIEGNTSVGNDSNGGEVMRRTRENKFIVGAVRPVFEKEIDKEDVSNMTVDEFISKLTNKQAYTLLNKALVYMGEMQEPDWSTKEGHWQRATARGFVNGKQPESLIKRDEFIAVLGRAGLV